MTRAQTRRVGRLEVRVHLALGRGAPRVVLIAIVLAGCVLVPVASDPAVSVQWTQQHPATSPSPREFAAAATDPSTGHVVLFGGAPISADTWTWDGRTWTQQHPATSPPARDGAAIALDRASGKVVLFGGCCTFNGTAVVPLGDTWTWDGATWTQRHPPSSPVARDFALMSTDPSTGHVILFGGSSFASGVLADTWIWDGIAWTQRHPATSPPGRSEAMMATDIASGRVIVFGGFGGTPCCLGDTWTWDGTTWTQEHPVTSPSARSDAAMATDPTTGHVILFGGAGPVGDTWTWTGAWTQQHPPTSPSARLDDTMAADPASHAVVLFGGRTATGDVVDTWNATTSIVAVRHPPTSKRQCKHGGWRHFTDGQGRPFNNQDACIRFVARHRDAPRDN